LGDAGTPCITECVMAEVVVLVQMYASYYKMVFIFVADAVAATDDRAG
jgi:hypothetical protein